MGKLEDRGKMRCDDGIESPNTRSIKGDRDLVVCLSSFLDDLELENNFFDLLLLRLPRDLCDVLSSPAYSETGVVDVDALSRDDV